MMARARVAVVEASGSGLGFEEFFREEYPRLARGLYLVTRNAGEAEDLAQEAMARIYERWDRVAGMESPVGYAFRTAMNLHRHRLRRLAVRARQVFAAPPDPDPADRVSARTDVADAVATLPAGQREALLLVDWLGLDSEEAGRVLGIEPVSVRTRLHRARAVLRERLEVPDE